MARRVVEAGINNDESTLSLSVCNSQLVQLAKRVQNDCKDFSAEKLAEWKQTVLSLAKESACVGNTAYAAGLVKSQERQRPRPENSEERESIEAVTKKMMKAVQDLTKNYDDNEAPVVQKVSTIMKIGEDEDEDIQMLGEEYQESSFKCPFTTQRMVEPMTK